MAQTCTVAAARCTRGRPRPVLRFCRHGLRRCPGSCVRIRRSQPIECAAVESKLFSLGLRLPSTTPAFAHEHRRRVYRPRNKLACCRANWGCDEIAIGSHRWIHQRLYLLSPTTLVRHPKMVLPAGGAQSHSCLCPMVGGGGWIRQAAEARDSQKRCHPVSSIELTCSVEAPLRMVSGLG